MVYECRYVHVWTVVKNVFLIGGVIGFFFGLVYAVALSLIGSLLDMVGGSEIEAVSGLFSGTTGFFMVFFISFAYAVMGAVMAALVSMLYNLFARLFGGIKVTLHSHPVERSRAFNLTRSASQVSSSEHLNSQEESTP